MSKVKHYNKDGVSVPPKDFKLRIVPKDGKVWVVFDDDTNFTFSLEQADKLGTGLIRCAEQIRTMENILAHNTVIPKPINPDDDAPSGLILPEGGIIPHSDKGGPKLM